MALEPLEQLILHWLVDEGGPDHVELGSFLEHLEAAGAPAYQDLRRDADLVGVQLPSKKTFLALLQGLIDRGYAWAAVGDVEWDDYEEIKDTRKLPKDVDPWDVSLYRTEDGLEEIESIEDDLENQAKGREFTRKYLEEVRAALLFPATIPPYILADENILAELEIGADENALRLSYSLGSGTWTRITIDQMMGTLPEFDETGDLLSDRSRKMGSVAVSLREYQLNVHIALIVAEWMKDGVSFRVALRRENIFLEDYHSELQPLTIDTAMRKQMFKIVRSCLSGRTHPIHAFPQSSLG